MGSVHETVKTVNSTIRTLIAAVLVAAAGVLGYHGYALYNQPQTKLRQTEEELATAVANLEESQKVLQESQRENGELKQDVARKQDQIDRLETSLRLLKVRRRLAQLDVLEQTGSADDGTLRSRVQFVETNEEGSPIGEPRQFEIDGDMVYVEYLVAKFDDQYVEQADLERGTAICLFQRIFGENQEPTDGYRLDEVGTRPTAYARGGAISEFERQIWDDFWTIANDPVAAGRLGIRAAHGNAASIRVRPGQSYQLELRATGEFSLRPTAQDSPR